MEKQKFRKRTRMLVCICSVFILGLIFALTYPKETKASGKKGAYQCTLQSVTFEIDGEEYVCDGSLSDIPVGQDVDWKDFLKKVKITDYKVLVDDGCSHEEGHDSITAYLTWWDEYEESPIYVPFYTYEDNGNEVKDTYPEVEEELDSSYYSVRFCLDGDTNANIRIRFSRECQISYDLNGGSFPEGLDVPYTCMYWVDLVAPVKSGSQFLGWTIAGQEDSEYIDWYYWNGSDAATTFVANWDDNTAPIDINTATIELDSEFEYEEGGVCLDPDIKYGDSWLWEGWDYLLSYENNDKIATADSDNPPTVVITGIGKYTGTVKKKFTIEKADPFSGSHFYYVYVPIAQGKPLSSTEPASRIPLPEGVTGSFTWENEDYVLEASVGDYEMCTFTFVPDDQENYKSVTRDVKVYVYEGNIADCTVTFAPDQNFQYTGEAIKPEVIVKDGDKVLIEGDDYWVSYAGYINAADSSDEYAPTVTIKGYDSREICGYFGTQKITYTIEKVTPYIKTAPTATAITYGETLGDSMLSGGAVQWSESNDTPVEGTFTWKEATAKPKVADSGKTRYVAVFNPTDTEHYTSAEIGITLVVNKAATAPNKPESTMNTVYTNATVGNVTLPEDWVWKDADKNTELAVGTPVTATAVYNGADKGNYVNETVSVTITRLLCDHARTELRNVKVATCTETGYTGDTYCRDCGVKIKTGTATDALGHNYISKVTTEPTTSSEGVMTYTCDRCGDSYTRPIDKLQDTNNDKPGDDIPDTGKPYIKGDDGKEGWDVIKDEVEKSKDGDTVVVEMNGSSVVPGDVFDEIKGKDITIVFDMGNGITWKVNGQSITGDRTGDINFSVKVGTNTIPVEVINNVTGDRYSQQISLAYEGEFGFTAVLSINMEKKNAGLYANLFYYNERTGELEFICADKIAEDGIAELTFTHASDYTIVIDEKPMDGSGDSVIPGDMDKNDDAPATGDRTLIVWLFILAGFVGAGLGMFYAEKKKMTAEK